MIKINKGHLIMKGEHSDVAAEVLVLLTSEELLKLFIGQKLSLIRRKELEENFSFKDYLKLNNDDFDESACDKFIKRQQDILNTKIHLLDELINCSNALIELSKNLNIKD